MKRLFLSSAFGVTASMLEQFAGEKVKGKSVTFIPTAANVDTIRVHVWMARRAFSKLGIAVDELDVSTATSDEIAHKLNRNDYMYVSGGNTSYLLQELKRSGTDKLIVQEIAAGKVYIGESAGSMVVAPDIGYSRAMDSPAKAPDLDSSTALGVVDFYPVPHQGNFLFKKAVKKIIAEYDSLLPLRPFSDRQVIFVEGDDVRVENH
jgi:dipeptidase E